MEVQAAILKLGIDKCPSIDGWTGRELRMLPPEAIKELTIILNLIETNCAWPAQILQVLVVLIPKPKGGDRPISLVSLIFKLWEVLNACTITKWEDEKIVFWDDAVRGSSALRAAALRRLRAEAASLMGEEFTYILWDAEKFYDNVDLLQLFESAIACGLDGREAVLGLAIFMAPRTIRIGRVVGSDTTPSNGMIAGIKRANYYSRLLLYNMLETMHQVIPAAAPRSFVDDLAQLITGDEETVIDLACRSVRILIAMLKGIKIVVSGKTMIIGSRLRIAKAIQKRILSECGVDIFATRHGTDLGIDCGGATRAVSHQTDRGIKADARNTRAKFLTSLCRRAESMVSTGSNPQRSYGFCVMGMPPAKLDHWRASNASAIGIATSACKTSAFALRGDNMDPALTVPSDQIRFWLELYSTADPVLQVKLQTAWFKIPARTSSARWKAVTGPCAASFLTQAQIGWKPIGPDAYRDPTGAVWSMGIGRTDSTGDGTNGAPLGNHTTFIRQVKDDAANQL